MTWRNFTVYIYPDFIRIVFTQDPRAADEQGKKIITMLEKAEFKEETRPNYSPQLSWMRDRTDFWVEQCTKLAQKFGANVLPAKEAPNITPEAPNITDPIDKVSSPIDKDVLGQMQEQMAAMQAEILRLREEVEELKKLDAIA